MSLTITPKELQERLGKEGSVVLLDVREPWENSMAKIEGKIADDRESLMILESSPGSRPGIRAIRRQSAGQ